MVKAVLHLGAHRCATTTFQTYLDVNREGLARNDIALWTPQNTRNGQFQDFFCQPGEEGSELTQAQMRLRAQLDAMQESRLLVSEENMIGAPCNNLDTRMLYPGFLPRLSRFKSAFAGHVTHIGLSIRSYDSYWASLLSFAVLRGYPMPDAQQVAALAEQPNSWRQLIAELRNLFPNVALKIQRFEDFANRPDRTLTNLIGPIEQELAFVAAKKNYSRDTVNLRRLLRNKGREDDANRLPRTRQRWMPFSAQQQSDMQRRYAQDIEWLEQNADPYITYTKKAAIKVPRRPDTGDRHDLIEKMGRNRRERTAWQAP